MALRKLVRLTLLMLTIVAAGRSQALQLAYEPVALGWSATEVDRAAAATLAGVLAQAARRHALGCASHCRQLGRLFDRLVVVARQQTPRAASLPWSLVVVREADIDAMALAGGQVIVSEAFIDRKRLGGDDALAFVLAHEMAHGILEHERQALTFARMLLPRQVRRSVADVYAEMDFDFGLVKAMEPVLQQGEFEADELGLLLASWAGFDPERQLSFLTGECAADAPETIVETHPPACVRLARLRERLPLAQRLRALHDQGGVAPR